MARRRSTEGRRPRGVDASGVRVDAREAVVTLRGSASASDVSRIESVARSVEGIESLRNEITARS